MDSVVTFDSSGFVKRAQRSGVNGDGMFVENPLQEWPEKLMVGAEVG